MANYTENKKIAGLDVLTDVAQNDFHIVGDTSDSGKAKAITEDNLEIHIANSETFINELTENDLFQTNVTNIVNNSTDIEIDLSTQVTGVLPLVNGGTGSALTDPGEDSVFVFDNTTNTSRLAKLANLTYNTSTNTLTAFGSGGGGTKLEINTDDKTLTGSTTETTFYTVIIPANTLGTNDAIRSYMEVTSIANGSSATAKTFRVKYGGTTVATLTFAGSTSTTYDSAIVRGCIVANDDEALQKAQFELIVDGQTVDIQDGTAAIDSTTDQNFVLTVQLGDTGQTVNAGFVIVEEISSGTNTDVNNVTEFDDFTSQLQTVEGGGGTDDAYIMGNFIITGYVSDPFLSTEIDHPGIIRLGNDQSMQGFVRALADGSGVASLLSAGNEFEVTILSRIIYDGTSTALDMNWGMANVGTLNIAFTSGVGAVSFSGTPSAVTVPATNTWFLVKFINSGGNLTVMLDGQVAYSASFSSSSSTDVNMLMNYTGGAIGSGNLDVDYVLINYKLSRQ